ncbi:NAD(P)/FAD-dependent oxidoreductase [Microbacterium sp. MYb64]|uniref:NAD(P)/FAD-dependent oxidoreductase n=1 Tax=Microbacterium sp. MYb64 TaxID=1848691 RepID=UPI000CFC7B02|nr:NAD(P)/FAD-dependent oxidoreductase [Microbacterium sp. MYb64]PRB00971.1 thioredoxin reductase [Microbacterium sp. MYb64]
MYWDAIVLGGGAAGLSAGIVLARTGVEVVLVEDRTPRNAPASQMHGFLSQEGTNPEALLQKGREEMIGFGGRILAARAIRTSRRAGDFVVALEDGSEIQAPAVLVATGLRDVLPAVPGAETLWGDLVHHCPHCHGREVEGRSIAVIGGSNEPMSVHQAGLMRRYTDDVTFYTNGIALPEQARTELDAVGVVIDDIPVNGIEATTGSQVVVSLETGRQMTHQSVFVAPTMEPRDAVVEELDLTRAPGGSWIEVGPTGRTSVAGVWAAGNVANPRAQVITAAGEGSAAAVDMSAYLLDRDLRRAVGGEAASWFVR